jgi:predicted nucleic acid-binding protein
MTRYAIDAAALLAVVGERLPVHPDHQLVAPNAVRSRALTLLLQAVQRGELTDAQARDLHRQATELRIRVLSDRVSRWTAFEIARERGWATTADAEYLAVARLQADALVALDDELAGLAAGVVPLAPLSALSEPEA